jgi:hypothetical protein
VPSRHLFAEQQKTQLMEINKPKGTKPQTTERKLGNGLNWQVTLRQQGVK